MLENQTIKKTAEIIIDSFQKGGKLLIAGNGGSAADAQHFAGELLGKFKRERKALPAIALNVNASVLTAIANDYCFDRVFSRQIEGLAKKEDIFFGISTSGNSSNIIEALRAAQKIGCQTIGLTGKDGGRMKELCDFLIRADSQDTPQIQEFHIAVIHSLCELIEKSLENENEKEF